MSRLYRQEQFAVWSWRYYIALRPEVGDTAPLAGEEKTLTTTPPEHKLSVAMGFAMNRGGSLV